MLILLAAILGLTILLFAVFFGLCIRDPNDRLSENIERWGIILALIAYFSLLKLVGVC